MEAFSNAPAYSYVAEIELVYKPAIKPSQRPKIIGSDYAAATLRECWDENKLGLQEQFKVLLLNRANKALGIYEASTGGLTGTIVDVKLVFAAALKAVATSIILAHNHPSGELKPSEADRKLTRKIREAGSLLEIHVLDHIILTSEGYYSFADNGAL